MRGWNACVWFAAAAALFAAPGLAQDQKPSASSTPVDATFTTADGKPVRLSDSRGRQAVVLLFTRGFTGEFACFHCSHQAQDYAEAYRAFRQEGAEVLFVLPGARDVKGFLGKVAEGLGEDPGTVFQAPFPVVLDTDFSACRAFDVPYDGTGGGGAFPVDKPATIVVGKDGVVLYVHHGKDPSDRPRPEAVLAVLRGEAPEPGKEPLAEGKSSVAAPPLPFVAFEAGMAEARAKRRPAFLEFYADW